MRRARRGAALVAACVLVGTFGARGAGADIARGTGTAGEPRIALLGQDPWTPLGGDLHLELRVDSAVPGLQVSVTAHQALGSRTALSRTASGGSLGSVQDQVVVPLDAVPSDQPGERSLTVGLEAPGAAREEGRLGVRRTGVYPLAIELRGPDDRTLSRFVSYLVAVEATPTGTVPLKRRLGVAWVWPLIAAPSTLPDGTPDPGVVASFRPDGRLGRQAAVLQRSADVPLTVVPGAETLQSWTNLGRDKPALAVGADAVRSSAVTAQMIDGPFVPVDLPSLLAGGLAEAVDTQLAQGTETLQRLLDAHLDQRTALARPVGAVSLTRLRAGGVDRVVVDSSAIAASSARMTTARPFLLQPASDLAAPVSAVASDNDLAALLGGGDAPALRAQRLLAGLSLVALEEPNDARAVVVANPDAFDPPTELLDAVLAGLRGNPWLAPMTVNDVFEQIPPETASNGTAVTRSLAPYLPPRAHISAIDYVGARTRLDAFRSLVPPGDERVTIAQHGLVSSVSSAWNVPGGAVRATAELGAVDAQIGAFLAQIQVPAPSTITLTSQSGEIPLTFRNDTGQTVSVLVELQSQKLAFPDGASRLVDLPPRSTTIRFAVEARTSGQFPLRLTVRSADGVLPITDTDFRVRSTAVSTVGLALIIGAGLFLALWWGWDIRRRRRARAA